MAYPYTSHSISVSVVWMWTFVVSSICVLPLYVVSVSAVDCVWFQAKATPGDFPPFEPSDKHNPGFFGKAKFELILKDDGNNLFTPTSLALVSGNLAVEGTVVTLLGANGGRVTATNGTYTCEVAVGPMLDNYAYVNTTPVDYFNAAFQMAGGQPATGEFYLDKDGKPIHLRPDAISANTPNMNWFDVENGNPANLDKDSNTEDPSPKNPDFKFANPGGLLLLNELLVFRLSWGQVFVDALAGASIKDVWHADVDGNARPFVDATGAMPYGVGALLDMAGTSATNVLVDATKELGIVMSWTPTITNVTPANIPQPGPPSTETTTVEPQSVESTPTSQETAADTISESGGAEWQYAASSIVILSVLMLLS